MTGLVIDTKKRWMFLASVAVPVLYYMSERRGALPLKDTSG
jgi:hypothetical protein